MEAVGEIEAEVEEKHPYLVVEGWQESPEARSYMSVLLTRNKRRSFGLLERPLQERFGEYPVLSKRLFLVGKSGVGKTSTADKLCGREISSVHVETLGIQTSLLYWPAKLLQSGKVFWLELELWDSGEREMKMFDHILPACQEATDGTIFFFSYVDRYSWDDLPHVISRTSGLDSSSLKAVVGTHADSLKREISSAEVEQFQKSTRLNVLPTGNVGCARPTQRSGRAEIAEISPFMNTLAQTLLAHELQHNSCSAVAQLITTKPSSYD